MIENERSKPFDGSPDATESYTKSLVSYIDILGFADLIESTKKDKSTIAEIISILMEMKKLNWEYIHRDPKNAGAVVRTFRSFNFSDLVVRSTGIPDGANVGDRISSELFFLGYAQLSFALRGVLIRGGICIGDIFADTVNSERDIVFGPALVKSYTLERYAVYPRIIIDREIIWNAEQNGYGPQVEDYLRQGEDGAHFLDYLLATSLTGFVVPGAAEPKGQIETHRKMIEQKIKNDIRHQDERIKQKVMWLALYHNSTVRNPRLWGRLSGEADRFVIPDDLLDF